MKKLILLHILFVALLTGVSHTLFYSTFIINLVVGFTYFLGIFGLYSIYESLRFKEKRWLILFIGFLSVLIAVSALEAMFREYGRI